MPCKSDILATLTAFVNQRPGLDFANYGDTKLYQSEYRRIYRDKQDYDVMLSAVLLSDSITGEDVVKASKTAHSGRLTFLFGGNVVDALAGKNDPEKIEINYVAGQDFSTEYRQAACSILASALWNYWRDSGYETGTAIRQKARQTFGRGIANRWFY